MIYIVDHEEPFRWDWKFDSFFPVLSSLTHSTSLLGPSLPVNSHPQCFRLPGNPRSSFRTAPGPTASFAAYRLPSNLNPQEPTFPLQLPPKPQPTIIPGLSPQLHSTTLPQHLISRSTRTTPPRHQYNAPALVFCYSNL